MTDLPIVTVAIASFNAATHLEAAIRSALAQSLAEIEVVVVDDGSSDGSAALAQTLAAEDPRVRFFQLPENRGPAGARNEALRQARGRWFAVLDSDDLMHPERLAGLIACAERAGADILADELVLFHDDGSAPPEFFLGKRGTPGWIDLSAYLSRTVMYEDEPNLGFLKPVIRMDALRAAGLCYDERLKIAEDDDFVVRMLLAGLRYWIEPTPGYFYRKHAASISHRLSAAHAAAIFQASTHLGQKMTTAPADARAAFARRHAALRRAYGFARLIEALKQRRPARAIAIAAATPGAIPLLRMPIGALAGRLRDRMVRPAPPPGDPRAAAALQAIAGLDGAGA